MWNHAEYERGYNDASEALEKHDKLEVSLQYIDLITRPTVRSVNEYEVGWRTRLEQAGVQV